MSRVLVTGASGFVGSHVVPLLVARGHEVHAAGRGGGHNTNMTWHRADLMMSAEVEELMGDVRPDRLLHLAWDVTPDRFWESVRNIQWVEATLRLARVFAAYGGSRMVSAGTCAEYDLAHGFCTEFVTPTVPATLYGAAKHAVHSVLDHSADSLGLSLAWGRIFFLYGPGEPESKLVASVIGALLQGEDAECTAGHQVRDYLHVADVAGALVHLLESDVTGPVNIGSGVPVAVADLASRIGELMDASDRVRLGVRPSRDEEVPLIVADVRRLHGEVGWQPSLSLNEGLIDTIERRKNRA